MGESGGEAPRRREEPVGGFGWSREGRWGLVGVTVAAAEEGTSDEGVPVPRKGEGLAGEVPWVEAKLWRGSGEEELRWSGELDANRSGGEGGTPVRVLRRFSSRLDRLESFVG